MSNLRSKVKRIRERNCHLLEQEQQRILNVLINLGAVKVILFGPFARNDCGLQGDLDLLVVMDSRKKINPFIKNVSGEELLLYAQTT
ncbi:MAG: nucleotidyltransferase domain-containing protein [Bacillota bacterium]